MNQPKTASAPFRFELPIFKPTGALRISGRPDSEKHFVVFLEISRTKPGMVRIIPKAGGKYDWNNKVTFHLDLENLAELSVYFSDPAPVEPFNFYRKTSDQKEKILKITKEERGSYIVRSRFEKEETVLTLVPSDVFLLTQGLLSLIEEIMWRGNRN